MEGGWRGVRGHNPTGLRHFLGLRPRSQPRIQIVRAPAPYGGQKNLLSGGATEPGGPRRLRAGWRGSAARCHACGESRDRTRQRSSLASLTTDGDYRRRLFLNLAECQL